MPPKPTGQTTTNWSAPKAGPYESHFDIQLVRSTKIPWSLELRSRGQRALLGTKHPTYAVCHCVWYNTEFNWAGGHLQMSPLQSCLLLGEDPHTHPRGHKKSYAIWCDRNQDICVLLTDISMKGQSRLPFPVWTDCTSCYS